MKSLQIDSFIKIMLWISADPKLKDTYKVTNCKP